MVPLFFFKSVSFIMFFISSIGIMVHTRTLILVLVCIEMMLVSIELNFLVDSFNFNDIFGQLFVLFILMVAAAEIAIGLAFLIIYYRLRGSLDTKYIYLSKG